MCFTVYVIYSELSESLKDVYGFQMLLNALNLIYGKFIITKIKFIEDIIYNI